MTDKTEYVCIYDVCQKYINEIEKTDDKNEGGEIREVQPTKFDNFINNLEHIAGYKNKIDNKETSKEDVKKYREKCKQYEDYVLKTYLELDLRKTKFTLNDYIVEFYTREIKEPLTMETLGKYFYKFYYCTRVINDKEDPELKKRIANFLTKLLLDFIEKERYVGDKLSIGFIKNNKKDIDYSKYYNVEKETKRIVKK